MKNKTKLITGIGTAVFSLLTALSGLPYQLGDIATVIPPAWKATVFGVSVVATIVLRVWNSVLQQEAKEVVDTPAIESEGEKSSPSGATKGQQ